MLESDIYKEIEEWCDTIEDDDIRLFTLNFCKARYELVRDFVQSRYEIRQSFKEVETGIEQVLEVIDLPEGDCNILQSKLQELYLSMGGEIE